MVKASSRAVPYIVMAFIALPIVTGAVGHEVCITDAENPAGPNCKTAIPAIVIITLLSTLGIAGAGKSAVAKFAEVRRQIPQSMIDDIVKQVRTATAPPPQRTDAEIQAEIDARVQAELRRRGVVDPNRREGEF